MQSLAHDSDTFGFCVGRAGDLMGVQIVDSYLADSAVSTFVFVLVTVLSQLKNFEFETWTYSGSPLIAILTIKRTRSGCRLWQ
jgi:hypothetical protein